MAVTKKKRRKRRGRRPIGAVAMTAAERQWKRRSRLRRERAYEALWAAWRAADRDGKLRFLQELRSIWDESRRSWKRYMADRRARRKAGEWVPREYNPRPNAPVVSWPVGGPPRMDPSRGTE